MQDFEPGVAYPEAEVNVRIAERYEDYCLVRRCLWTLALCAVTAGCIG